MRVCVLIAVLLTGGLLFAQSDSSSPADDSERAWPLRRLRGAPVPDVTSTWPASPLDAFIGDKLGQQGLEPSPPADRRTLIRRLSFDLLGLPPTPEEFAEFQSDTAPDSVERLVYRMLASPHFGERWARQWMDVAHFAETHGHDQDRIRPNAWPYRDYLIDAFNEDRSYSRFIQDQVAGDVLFPDDPGSLVATGFLASGPWDESSLMSIQDDTDDRRIAQYIDRDDMLTTVMGSFVSLTVHCARCHDHKFDPIPQADYYALQAVFAGVDKAERKYDSDPVVGEQRRAWEQELAQLPQQPAADFLNADLQARIPAWEEQIQAAANLWFTTTPTECKSEQGSTLTVQPDGSVLSHDKKPEKDTYTLTFRLNSPVTGLRLEVLTHDSLFKGGPGRQDNGNLHLSEIRVTAAPVENASAKETVAIQSARSDFDQSGWTIQHAIDNMPATAWGVHPDIGKPHHAVFEFAKPIEHPHGSLVTVALEQLHGGGHLIGRPRISFTSARSPLPLDGTVLPAEVTAVLAVPNAGRTDEQRAELGRYLRKQELLQSLGSLPAQQMIYTATKDFQANGGLRPAATPRPIHLLNRGEIKDKRELASPGALSCVADIPARFTLADDTQEGLRRQALAQWLTDPQNGIVWRSIVNRLWHYHFGRGIVDTPNDFGAMANDPTHPELLEWLALDFRDHGGSLKRLHRQIVQTAAYRQSVRHHDEYANKDGDNRYLWRQNRQRLQAEQIRDAALQFSGRWDDRLHGPSARQFIESPGVQVTPDVNYLGFDADQPEHSRRSVYRFLFRTLPDPYHEALDCPDASQWAPVRNESLTALQALALLHDRILIRYCDHLAASLSNDVPAAIPGLYRLVFLREPTAEETAEMSAYTEKHGLANACRMLLNSNEFLYVD